MTTQIITWIDYTNGSTINSSVPVAIDETGANFCDGAYDVFDYYYTIEDDNAAFDAWADQCLLSASKLATMNDMDSVGLNANGEHWIFTRNDSRDQNGNMY